MDKNKIYFEKTKHKKVNKHTRHFYDSFIPKIGMVIDLGCGTGCDTEFFLRHGFWVLSIDSDIRAESFIKNRISDSPDLFELFKFENQRYETLKLEKNSANIVIAHNSLAYCQKENFYSMWYTIKQSIVKNGYFVGNFFGLDHSYKRNSNYTNGTFLCEKEVFELFSDDFELLEFNNPLPQKKKTAFDDQTLWHEYLVIAKKVSE